MTQYKNKYRNLWPSKYSPEFYENNAEVVLEYRGVKIYMVSFAPLYDFVYNNVCIAQRAGITKAKEVIDSMLDGIEPLGHEVYEFLTKYGFKVKKFVYPKPFGNREMT